MSTDSAKPGRLAIAPPEMRRLMEEAARGSLSDQLDIEIDEVAVGFLSATLDLESRHLGPHGFVHAGTVVTMADSCAGMGCMASLPEHAVGFMTLELKSNFLRSATAGDSLRCEAQLRHAGRTTQIWDAKVRRGDDGAIALFRCTQILLTETRDPRP